MNTDSRERESVTESKGSGWKWIPQQGVYLWWDGKRYTARAEWDGAGWHVTPPNSNEAPPIPATRRAEPPRGVKRAINTVIFSVLGLGASLGVDMLLLMMVANTPADEQLITETQAIVLLVMFAVAGIAIGAKVGWDRGRKPPSWV